MQFQCQLFNSLPQWSRALLLSLLLPLLLPLLPLLLLPPLHLPPLLLLLRQLAPLQLLPLPMMHPLLRRRMLASQLSRIGRQAPVALRSIQQHPQVLRPAPAYSLPQMPQVGTPSRRP